MDPEGEAHNEDSLNARRDRVNTAVHVWGNQGTDVRATTARIAPMSLTQSG